MELSYLRALLIPIDFSMCLFLWIVQIIIYPSFKYIKDSEFKQWHLKYMRSVGFLIGPIMLAQIVLLSLFAYTSPYPINLLRLLLLLSCWILTFVFSVPLHRKLERGIAMEMSKEKLVHTNWYRTITWSLIFLINFISN